MVRTKGKGKENAECAPDDGYVDRTLKETAMNLSIDEPFLMGDFLDQSEAKASTRGTMRSLALTSHRHHLLMGACIPVALGMMAADVVLMGKGGENTDFNPANGDIDGTRR